MCSSGVAAIAISFVPQLQNLVDHMRKLYDSERGIACRLLIHVCVTCSSPCTRSEGPSGQTALAREKNKPKIDATSISSQIFRESSGACEGLHLQVGPSFHVRQRQYKILPLANIGAVAEVGPARMLLALKCHDSSFPFLARIASALREEV